jgi:hypothetical protein
MVTQLPKGTAPLRNNVVHRVLTHLVEQQQLLSSVPVFANIPDNDGLNEDDLSLFYSMIMESRGNDHDFHESRPPHSSILCDDLLFGNKVQSSSCLDEVFDFPPATIEVAGDLKRHCAHEGILYTSTMQVYSQY